MYVRHPQGLSDIDKFMRFVKVDEATGCWVWQGYRLPNGYGRYRLRGGDPQGSHRVSWILHRGDIPSGQSILHRCDNEPCVNPDHLFLGTQKTNVMDSIMKGRRGYPYVDGDPTENDVMISASIRLSQEQEDWVAERARSEGHSNVALVLRRLVSRHMTDVQ